MSDQASTKRRGLFRRNRDEDEFEAERDLSELSLPTSDEHDEEWEAPIVASPAARAPRRTADMFAPKEKFADTWSEDSWDDEWKEPAVRRTSIPPAADPTPEKVDQWLESDASNWDDVTRESVRKMGADPSHAAAARSIRPGSTWDDTGDVASSEAADPDLHNVLERALATQQAASNDVDGVGEAEPPPVEDPTGKVGGVSRRFGRSRSTIVPPVSAAPAIASSVIAVPIETSPLEMSPIETSPVDVVSATVGESVEPAIGDVAASTATEHIVDIADKPVQTTPTLPSTPTVAKLELPIVPNMKLDSSRMSRREGDIHPSPTLAQSRQSPTFTPSELPPKTEPLTSPVEAIAPVEIPTKDVVIGETTKVWVTDRREGSTPEIPVESVKLVGTDSEATRSAAAMTVPDIAAPSVAVPEIAAPTVDAPTQATLPTESLDDRTQDIEMDRTRAAAFVDRATWIGTGLAAVAGLRLALHVASGLKQANPLDGALSGLARIGSGFANAGALHGLLLVAAVTLLSLPALFNRDDLVPRRTGSGLGLALGGATLGIIGAVISLVTQSSWAKAAGTTVSLGSRGELIAMLGLAIVALGATLRSLRSYD
jgi:hypothetical protein